MAICILVFALAEHRYGLGLPAIVEIVRLPTIVPLPKAPPVVEGVVNVRGRLAAVLDLRRRFCLPDNPPHPAEHLVVARAGERLVALRVDRVLGIETVEAEELEVAASVTPRAEYLVGVAKLANGLVLVHDLATFLADAEARDLDEALDDLSTVAP